MKRVFGRFFLLFEFVPRVTLLQIELESWNLLCLLSKSPRCAFWNFPLFWGKIQLRPNLGEGVLRGQNHKTCPFPSQSIENKKLYNISKSQPPKWIRKEDMKISPFLTSKNCCSSLISPPNWARKLKFDKYLHLLGIQDMLLGSLDFSAPFQPLPAPKKWFFHFYRFSSLFLA